MMPGMFDVLHDLFGPEEMDRLVATCRTWLPYSNWEDLEYDIARAFEGQMKNLDRVWEKYSE